MERSFEFYDTWWEAIRSLPAYKKRGLLEAVVKYGLYGEEDYGIMHKSVRGLFAIIKSQMDSDRKLRRETDNA